MYREPAFVLLVEDNQDHAELVMRSLSDCPIPNRVLHLTDGQAALDYLCRQGEYAHPDASPRPDVILLDLRLPRLDGLHVLKTIKVSELLRPIPVVILTTSDADRDIALAYGYQANSYLVKPVGFEEFSQLMQDLSSYWMGWNTRPKL
jgi:CheY-like chemotaxis protein